MSDYQSYLEQYSPGMAPTPGPRTDLPRDIDPSVPYDGGMARDRQDEMDLINKFAKTKNINMAMLNEKRRTMSRADYMAYLRTLAASTAGGRYWDEVKRRWVYPGEADIRYGSNPPPSGGNQMVNPYGQTPSQQSAMQPVRTQSSAPVLTTAGSSMAAVRPAMPPTRQPSDEPAVRTMIPGTPEYAQWQKENAEFDRKVRQNQTTMNQLAASKKLTVTEYLKRYGIPEGQLVK